MNANLELYRVFCEVVKYQNISKAAENMSISQSAVTQSIQKLENMLGGKLFFRSKVGVELTKEGKNLYEYVKDSIEKMSNAEEIFSNYLNLEKGKIRIGGGNVLVSTLILPTLMEFIKKYPNIEIEIIQYSTKEAIQKLANGELDLIALTLSENTQKNSNVEIIHLKKEPRYCFFASKSYLKKNPIKNISELEKHKLIMPRSSTTKFIFDEYCQSHSLNIKAHYEIGNANMIKEMILNDLGVSFSNFEYIKDMIDEEKVEIIEQFESGSDIECIAILKKNMCNKATLKLANMIEDKYK